MSENLDFDMQAAWLRRFKADAESNLTAFALRLKEAMPDLVTVHESRGFFSGARTTGVSVELGENRYSLAIDRGRLKATIAPGIGAPSDAPAAYTFFPSGLTATEAAPLSPLTPPPFRSAARNARPPDTGSRENVTTAPSVEPVAYT